MGSTHNESDLDYLINCIRRNKGLVSFISLATLTFTAYSAFSTPRTWQGEFQIVLQNKKAENLPLGDSEIQTILGISSSQNNELTTQLQILKSPSVLMGIFDFVKERKGKRKNMRFRTWEKKLNINLTKNTSVLNLTYKDKDKSIIIPVLDRISKAYQDYSGRERLRKIDLGMEYFENQITDYKKQSRNSKDKAQEYATTNNISVLQEHLNQPSKINNEIRLLDNYLDKINKLEGTSDQYSYLIYLATKINIAQDILEQLAAIEKNLSDSRRFYKEDDKSITNLIQLRYQNTNLLKNKIKEFINAKKAALEVRIKTIERPKKVLIKYQQLLSTAQNDKATLNSLESKYIKLSLEKAKSEDPWELITTPTLFPNPIAPRRKRILFLGLVSSIIFGSLAALIREREKAIIFSSLQIKSLTKYPILSEFDVNNPRLLTESIALLSKGSLLNIKEKLALIAIDKIPNELINKIFNSLREVNPNLGIHIAEDLKDGINYNNIVLLTALNISTKNSLVEICSKISKINNKTLGIIVIKDLNSGEKGI
tara:strand:+ start:16711 stop:18333 length:1623 start_codon:yes stop_codon:yes gene_type:complete